MECEPRDCEVETALDRLLNDIVVPATEITVTTWIYFGKMSIINGGSRGKLQIHLESVVYPTAQLIDPEKRDVWHEPVGL